MPQLTFFITFTSGSIVLISASKLSVFWHFTILFLFITIITVTITHAVFSSTWSFIWFIRLFCQKWCHTHFPGNYFDGLFCRLRSIFQPLIPHHVIKIFNNIMNVEINKGKYKMDSKFLKDVDQNSKPWWNVPFKKGSKFLICNLQVITNRLLL